MALKKSVSLWQAVFYGIGIIFGAGIYALIGSAAGIIGNMLWLPFLLASIVAALTAFSYAELSSYFPKAAAESVYVKEAFGKEFLSFFIGFVVLITILFSIATVAWGFTSYFKLFFLWPSLLVAIGLIVICSIINFFGIEGSVKLNFLLTIIGGSGLVIIIIFGLPFVGSVNLFEMSATVSNTGFVSAIFSSIALIFFAYIGFEGIANISEEVTSAKTIVPKAIIISLVIATIIYVLVAIVSVSAVSPIELANANNSNNLLTGGPLALVADKVVMPGFGYWLSLAALFATSSTILLLLVVSSRLLYGLANLGFLPKIFSKTHSKTKTPYFSVIVVGSIGILFLFIGDIEMLGNLTTLGTFLMFFFVNASLIAIRIKENPKKLNFISPVNIGKFPILAIIGAIFCAFMFLTQYWQKMQLFQIPLIIFGLMIFLISVPIYLLFKKDKNIKKRIKEKKWPNK
ncbi:MAG: APC family permease [Candidatus ainarchaeum sp.]|nr:APC family permease [Candidatus ainarchaeum sp.]